MYDCPECGCEDLVWYNGRKGDRYADNGPSPDEEPEWQCPECGWHGFPEDGD